MTHCASPKVLASQVAVDLGDVSTHEIGMRMKNPTSQGRLPEVRLAQAVMRLDGNMTMGAITLLHEACIDFSSIRAHHGGSLHS